MKLNKRPVDQTVADEGVWVEIYDASGEHYGTYRIRYAVGDLKYRAAVQQIRKRLSKSEMFRLTGDKPDVELAHKINVEAFCRSILIDWKDLPVDKLPAYTPEAAMEFLNAEPWLYDLIEDEAARHANFRKEAQEASAKN